MAKNYHTIIIIIIQVLYILSTLEHAVQYLNGQYFLREVVDLVWNNGLR